MLKLLDGSKVQDSEEYRILLDHLTSADGFVCILKKDNATKVYAVGIKFEEIIFNLELLKQKYILADQGLIDFD